LTEEANAATREPARVLVITADVEFVEDMRAVLHAHAEIRHAASTAMAVAEIFRQQPELVWIDLDLVPFFTDSSSLEGLGFLEVLRDRIDPTVPVLVTSSRADVVDATWMERFRIAAWLPKPPPMGSLLEILARLPGGRPGHIAALGNYRTFPSRNGTS